MYKHETFPNAPITEALIDFRVTFERDVSLVELDNLHKKLSECFPNKKTRKEFEYQLRLEEKAESAESHTRSRNVGYVLFSKNGDRAVQLRLDGFAFSKMKPYKSWSSLRDEAREHWETYRKAMNPSRIARLAVRYINRIELPLPLSSFEDYVLTRPQVADSIPQELAEFFFRVVIPNPDDNQMRANIMSTMEHPKQGAKVLPYIFDVDAFTPVEFDPSSDKIWSTMEKLRDYKNLIFFLSMTEKAKELFR